MGTVGCRLDSADEHDVALLVDVTDAGALVTVTADASSTHRVSSSSFMATAAKICLNSAARVQMVRLYPCRMPYRFCLLVVGAARWSVVLGSSTSGPSYSTDGTREKLGESSGHGSIAIGEDGSNLGPHLVHRCRLHRTENPLERVGGLMMEDSNGKDDVLIVFIHTTHEQKRQWKRLVLKVVSINSTCPLLSRW